MSPAIRASTTQCAAVITQRSLSSAPPQKGAATNSVSLAKCEISAACGSAAVRGGGGGGYLGRVGGGTPYLPGKVSRFGLIATHDPLVVFLLRRDGGQRGEEGAI